MSGLENLENIEGVLNIIGNHSLKNFSGLENLNIIDTITIASNDSLIDLTGIENLSSNSKLSIYNCDNLISFSGLENLTAINNRIIIQGNPDLVDISALENTDLSSLSSLIIRGNPQLTICNISSVCDYLSNPSEYANITGNAPGCNTIEEVEEACGIVGINDIEQPFDISIYPNPFGDKITMEINGELKADFISYQVINAMGEVVIPTAELENNRQEINTGNLPSGIYFIRLYSDSKSSSYKLVKL
jgi:hypothetical protein